MSNQVIKIAVVGMGVAGISVLREWTKEKANNPLIELTLFGDEKTFGTGAPYQKDDENLLMNVSADSTTIIPENKNDFVEWLENVKGENNPSLKYYSRNIVGTYLKEHMDLWIKKSKARVIKEKVKTVRVLENKQYEVTSSSIKEVFDVVHLCLGHMPYSDHYNLIDHPNFIVNPFPLKENMPLIPKNSKVAVLGMGLTSIDILRYIHFYRQDLNVIFFSNTGKFKTINYKSKTIDYICFTKENIDKTKNENNGFIPLDTYIDWFKKEIKNQKISLKENWINEPFGSKENIKKLLAGSYKTTIIQSILIGIGSLLPDLWMSLSEIDKETFINKYHTKWDKLRSPFPAESGEILYSDWANNKIQVFGGLTDIIPNKNSFKLILKDQDPKTAEYILNAVGPGKDVSPNNNRTPLLSQLVNERILQIEKFGGVQVTLPDLSAVSQRYGVLKTLKVHGQIISGIQFGNNSIDIISQSARTSVKDIAKKFENY